ncbi:MAG TPA: hypothetical protein VGP61_12990 [Gemmatimonadales bacterium]|jgi:hypothetical protein|nr:hypothetical protein [Gemmatimonadales bacterium]
MRRPRYFLNSILGVVIAAGACSNERPAPTEPGLSPDLVGLPSVTILNCTPLPVATSSAVVGRDGGTITVGPHSLVIPAKALNQDVLITASIAGDSANAIRFGPEGLQFKKPATLTMSFDNCGQWGQLRQLEIVYTDDQLKPKEIISSVSDNRTKSIMGAITHFSQYAVAY